MSQAPKNDVDKKAERREKRPHVVGGQEFLPKRRTNSVMREFRKLAREDDALAREQREVRVKLSELDNDESTKAEYDALQDRLETLEEDRNVLVYRMIAGFVKPKTGEGEADPEHFEEHIDIEDAGDLLDELMPGGGPDPTTPAETPATTS